MAPVEIAEKVAHGVRLSVVVTEISTEDSPETPRVATPPIKASLHMLDSPRSSEEEAELLINRKRRSPSSPNDETSPVPQRSRSILQPIDNAFDTVKVRSPTVENRASLGRHSSVGGETPSSFIGSPVKKKRRLSSIKRL